MFLLHFNKQYTRITLPDLKAGSRPHLDEYAMHAVSPIAGFRFLPSRVDLGMLEDIGCRVDYSQIPQFDDVFYGANPVKERYLSIYKGKKQPVGLWYFDIKKYVWGAIRGNHVKYVPSKNRRIFVMFREA